MRRPPAAFVLAVLATAAAGWALAGRTAGDPPANDPPANDQSANDQPAAAQPAEPRFPIGGAEAALSELGFSVTGGAAPGYVDDAACAVCHGALVRSYAGVGMARSFYRPRAATAVEDFASEFVHPPSQRHYRMSRDGDRYLFRRWQLDAAGRPINVFEQEVDWVVGSGNHSRVYLYRTPSGEMYELPLAWYSQQGGRWGMAPGFESADQDGVLRPVRRECMFCHNAYPDVPAGSDDYLESPLFPAELPQGIGCQRCHGPGARHAALGLTAGVDPAAARAAIVNPARLDRWRRDSICYGCHLQPAVAVGAVRRFDRADYSFRPGERLEDYVLPVDVEDEHRPASERFEINHHPYRLEQSRCFIASAGALSCLTCHDPHRKVPASERAEHYRAACLGCHEVGALPAAPLAGGLTHASPGIDCTSCHMPPRRPQDVVEVVMTDHKIQLPPAGVDGAAPLAKDGEPEITGVSFVYPQRAPSGSEGQLYLAATASRIGSGASRAALVQLDRLLSAGGSDPRTTGAGSAVPWFDLVSGLLRQQRFDLAPRAIDEVAARRPGFALVDHWRGLVLSTTGHLDAALAAGRAAVARDPERPEARYNLGVYLAAAGRDEEALAQLDEAVRLRTNLYLGWYYRGRVLRRLGRGEEAAASLRRALAVQPTFERGYLELAAALRESGDQAEARRYLEHARRLLGEAPAIAAALAEPAPPSGD